MQVVADRLSFDVLVVGSGASGLAAALSARRAGARVALATKGTLPSCNSAKAQGGIQAGDRTGHAITTALREAVEASEVATFPKSPLTELERGESGWRARCGDRV